MVSGAAPGDASPAVPVARESLPRRVRRYWRSRGRYGRLRYWVIFRGLPVTLGFGALYLATGSQVGWLEAYKITLAIDAPSGTRAPVLAWALSLAGWLVAPGIAGAVAGYVISAAIDARRRVPVELLFTEDDEDG